MIGIFLTSIYQVRTHFRHRKLQNCERVTAFVNIMNTMKQTGGHDVINY